MKKLKEPEEYKVKSETANGRTDDGENSLIALLLSQTCTRSQIESKGVTGLSGMDHDRMKLLLDANTLLPPEKQLVFRFVCLQHTNRIASSVNEAKLCASWFRLNGEKLGDDISFDWTKRLHFLNPGNELLRKSWGNARYIYSDCIYERCAVVAWPASADVVLSYELMGEYAATASILAKNPIDTAKLQELFIYRAYHLDQSAESTNNRNRAGCYAQKNNTVIYTVVPLTFCQKLCKAIGELGDVTLVDIFLMTYFVRLFDKVKLIPLLAELVRIFGWNAIEASILSALDGLLYDILMKLVMLLADELKDCQEAQTALMKYGLGKLKCVAAVTTTTFSTSCDLGLLWKNAMTCNDPQVFREVVELAKKIDVAMLGPVVNELSELVNRSSSGEHQAGWVAIACSRLQWLTAEIAAMEKPFQWQVLVSDCPDADDIVTFLQGPNKTLELTGFGSIVDARARVKALLSTITAPLEITANGRGSLSFVKIVKTSGVFAQNSKELAAYKAEAGHLTHLLQPSDVVNSMAEDANTSKVAVENSNACCDIETTNIVGNKRPREEEADVNAMSNTEGLQ
ncbi:hypothetical protein PHYBOEH_009513 [Phytophthora boehmeriae]|uniref:Uncharacterized protein n=1 Tax=Phytophthora boehmeriae TaxID=109152 RepID=A0A8T1XD22_9STRA|nr:hypothetical protein PHYBOEH_009513 [Phytophthora boehmeriae]